MTWVPFALGFLIAVGLEGVVIKLALRNGDWTAVVLWTFFWYLVALAVLWATGRLDVAVPWRGVFYASVSGLCAVSGLLLLTLALERGDASVVIPFTAAYPVVTALLAIYLLGENVTLDRALGLGLVVMGLILLGRTG